MIERFCKTRGVDPEKLFDDENMMKQVFGMESGSGSSKYSQNLYKLYLAYTGKGKMPDMTRGVPFDVAGMKA